MIEKPIKDFLQDLSSSDHIPGGGACAAISGAQAAALIQMVCQITLKKPSEKDDEINSISGQANSAMREFTYLAEQDMASFDDVMKYYQIPKDQRNIHELDYWLAKCVKVSIDMLENLLIVAQLGQQISKLCRKNIYSDVKASMALILAASSIVEDNLYANLNSMTNYDRSTIISQVDNLCGNIVDIINEVNCHG